MAHGANSVVACFCKCFSRTVASMHLCIVYGCATTEELSNYDRDHMVFKAENIIWPFTEKVCRLLL